MKKLWLILFCLSIALCFAHSSSAYENVNQGCLTCHPTTEDTGLHTIAAHSNCGSCHPGGVTGQNVLSRFCIACHPRSGPGFCQLVNFHVSFKN